jgi:hypothetical protein
LGEWHFVDFGDFGMPGKRTSILNEPCISKNEAAWILGQGRNKFKENFEKYYYTKIRHESTVKCQMLHLMDTLAVAFPQASKQTLHLMAIEVLDKIRDRKVNSTFDVK